MSKCDRYLQPLLRGAKVAIVPDHVYRTPQSLRSSVQGWGWQHRMWLKCRKGNGVFEVYQVTP